jgi:hypothetical protein
LSEIAWLRQLRCDWREQSQFALRFFDRPRTRYLDVAPKQQRVQQQTNHLVRHLTELDIPRQENAECRQDGGVPNHAGEQ